MSFSRQITIEILLINILEQVKVLLHEKFVVMYNGLV